MVNIKQALALSVMLAAITISAENVFVRVLGTRGGSQEIDIDANATVGDLKEAIQHQLGFPVELQERIIFSNKILKNNAEPITRALGGGDVSGRIFYLKIKN